MPAAVEEFVIQRASRTQTKLRLALQGPSGGGKTGTALRLALGMVAELRRRGQLPNHLDCHIGLLDTERDSAKLYGHLGIFDTLVLEPPYTVDRYLAALSALERVGYPVIIVDQITHEWNGAGGILAWVREIQAKGGNEFTAWKLPSEAHERFIDRLLSCPAHLIATMRAKTEWVLEEKEKNGRTVRVPTRIGMAAKQREGTEYEFTTVFDLAVDTNQARCLKDRTDMFAIGAFVPRDASYPPSEKSLGIGPDWGTRLIRWVYESDVPEPVAAGPSPAELVEAQCDAAIRAVRVAKNLPDLIKAFSTGQTALRGLSVQAGRDLVVPALERLIAAKDEAKALFGGTPAAEGEPITPDELLLLEQIVSDSACSPEAFKAHFAVPRIAALPAAQYDAAVLWICVEARRRGISLDVPARPQPRPVEKSLPEQMDDRLRAIGNARGGLFHDDIPDGPPPAQRDPGGFQSMEDDLPFTP